MNLPGGRSFGVEGRLCSQGESCSKPGSDLGLALPRGNGAPPGSDQPRLGVLKASLFAYARGWAIQRVF